MKTKIITITIELPIDSQQANNWVNENDFIESTVKEIFNEKIKNNLTNHSGNLETDDEIGSYILSISENKDKWIEIKTKEELPTNEGSYFVYSECKFPRVDIFTGRISNAFGIFSHYQKIEKPSYPQGSSKAEL